MPKLRVTLDVTVDGQIARRFPIVRSLDADIVEEFDFQKDSSLLSIADPHTRELVWFNELLEDKRIGDITALLLRPDVTMTFRLAGQADSGIVLAPEGIALIFNCKLCPAIVSVSDTNAIPGKLRGIVAGTLPLATIHVPCPAAAIVGPTTVNFTARIPDGVNVINVHWNFGDGTLLDTGMELTTTHIYSTIATFDVVVTLQLDDGCFIFSDPCPVTLPPLVLACPGTSITDLAVDFSITPPAAPVTNYHWDFGDSVTLDTGPTPSASHTYVLSGTYAVVVTATTSLGTVSTGDCPVTVSHAPPMCPDIGLPFDTGWIETGDLNNAVETKSTLQWKIERSPAGTGSSTLQLAKAIDSSTWGSCTRLVWQGTVHTHLDVAGGIPEAYCASNFAFSLLDCVGTPCDKTFVFSGSINAPFVGTLTLSLFINGNCAATCDIQFTQFELQP